MAANTFDRGGQDGAKQPSAAGDFPGHGRQQQPRDDVQYGATPRAQQDLTVRAAHKKENRSQASLHIPNWKFCSR